MNFFIVFLGIIFSIISAAILSYISMATMVGPWIAPALILLASPILRLRYPRISPESLSQKAILIQSIAAVGGIMATALGFALPVFFFLDKSKFCNWIGQGFPAFHLPIIAVCFSAGSLGIFLGRYFSDKLIEKDGLPFPISKLVYNISIAPSQDRQVKNLFTGMISTTTLCFLRDGLFAFKGMLPKIIYFLEPIFGKALAFPISPMWWAIGFETKLAVAVPLLVGMISKYFVLYPLNHHSQYISYSLFPVFDDINFATAFCSGLVLAEVIAGFSLNPISVAKSIYIKLSSLIEKIKKIPKLFHFTKKDSFEAPGKQSRITKVLYKIEPAIAILSSIAFLSYSGFSAAEQAFFLVATTIATYSINRIGGQIGLIQLGRFATFILIPMLFIFNLDHLKITMICVFFNICAATSSDLLFDYKSGQLCSISRSKTHIAQWIGLIVVSISMGFILHLLFSNFTVGSSELFAHRGKVKAMLVQSLNFNVYILSIGFLYGYILKKLKISPTMTLGGIVMPNNVTIGLIFGGLLSVVFKGWKSASPFCSGVFATESLWIIISTLLKMF
jgi:uncharacterized oligopeptide transporter (OPT) family protein